jgi:hypothetical protein
VRTYQLNVHKLTLHAIRACIFGVRQIQCKLRLGVRTVWVRASIHTDLSSVYQTGRATWRHQEPGSKESLPDRGSTGINSKLIC